MTVPEQVSPQLTAGEALLRTAIDCYLTAIFLFAECLEAVRPELALPYRDQLIRLRRRLAFDTTVETLVESRETLPRAACRTRWSRPRFAYRPRKLWPPSTR